VTHKRHRYSQATHARLGVFIAPDLDPPSSPQKAFVTKTPQSQPPSEQTARGERLKRAREAAGFKTASAAAKANGWNRNTYSSNENGNAAYSYKAARGYAHAFGVSVGWLYDGEEPHGKRPNARRRRADALLSQAEVAVIGEVMSNGSCRLAPIAAAPPPGLLGLIHVYLLVGPTGLPGVAEGGALLAFKADEVPPSPGLVGKLVVAGLDDGSIQVGRLTASGETFRVSGSHGPVSWAQPIDVIIMPTLAGAVARPIDAPP
jgi:transcriptional regulator with XRE-family HTH domain